jgi:LPXTG-site transpeptidase (sortase) family protein
MAKSLAGQGIVSNIGDVTDCNWESFQGLYFEKRTNVADPSTAIGKITFNSALNLSLTETQTFLNNLWTFVDMSTGRIAFNASTSAEFAAHGATLVMYNLPAGVTLDLLTVRDDNGTILDASTIVSGFTQDPVTGNVTFTAAHFTQFDINTTSLTRPATTLPATGFAPDRMTVLPNQPANKTYTAMGDLWLEIPSLNIKATILGVPTNKDGWDLTWLGSNAGWLQGTAFPTWAGNSALTAHVVDADGQPGLFANLNQLGWGDKVIVHAWGQSYIYEVRSTKNNVRPNDTGAIKHEDYPWLTLITCKGYDSAKDSYRWRVVVRAVQVRVE